MDMNKVVQALQLTGELIDKSVPLTGIATLSNASYVQNNYILFNTPATTKTVNATTYGVLTEDFGLESNNFHVRLLGDAGLFSIGPRHWMTNIGIPYDDMQIDVELHRTNGVHSSFHVTGNEQLNMFLGRNDYFDLKYTGSNSFTMLDNPIYTFTRLSRNPSFEDQYED